MSDSLIQRVYEIKLSGYDDAIAKQAALTKAFGEADAAKKKLNESLKQATATGDTAAANDLTAKIKTLNAELEKLARQKGIATKEAALLSKAEGAAAKAAADYATATKATGPALSTISGSIEKYTGSIQENIKAQLANNQSLEINKAAQKSVGEEIKKSGTATNDQINRLAKLKEESLLLSQSNRDLTTTIKAQGKEFLSSSGSIDEGRNKLNLLQEAYAKLSEQERNSSFGDGLKKEIDTLEPQVKSLAEGAEGLIDVDGALEKVVDSGSKASGVFGKMFSGLKGIANIIPGLGLSGIVGLLLVPLGALASAIFDFITKSSTAISEFQLRKTALNEINSKSAEIVAKETIALNQNFSVLKDGKLTVDGKRDALQNLINLYPVYFGQLDREKATINQITDAYNRATKAINSKAFAEASADVAVDKQAGVNKVISTLTKFRTPVENKTATSSSGIVTAVSQLTPEDIKTIKDATKDLDGIVGDEKNGILVFTTADYNKIVQRINGVIAAKQKEANVYNSLAGQYALTNQQVIEADKAAQISKLKIKVGNLDLTRTEVEELIKSTQSSLDLLKLNDPKRKQLEAELKKYQDLLSPPKAKEPTASKLTAIDKDKLAEIETLYKTALTNEGTRLADLKGLHDLSYTEELTHLNKINDIDNLFLNKKIKYLTGLKNINIQEKLQLATFQKELSDANNKFIDDRNTLQDKQFVKEVKDLEKSFEQQKKFVSDKLKQQLNNPDLLPSERLDAERASNEVLLALETDNLKAINELHKKYGGELTDNERKIADGIKKIVADLGNNRRQSFASSLADIDEIEKRALATLNISYNKKKDAILSGKGSTGNKKELIDRLDIAQSIDQARIEMEAAAKRYNAAKEKYEADGTEASKQIYDKFFEEFVNRKEALENLIDSTRDKVTSVGSLISKAVRSIFDIKKNSAGAKLVDDTLSQAYDFAKTAMNSYFDARRDRIEADKQLSYERIDLEKQQLLNQAQSAAERDSIERQSAAKKKEIDKEALEQNKKMQRAQAAINLGIQLSNLAVVVAASLNPLNGLTFGAAGAIAYGIQAALALANYEINIGRINNAKAFAGGGRVLAEPVGNGRITNSPNIPTQSNGDNIFATVKTNEVILNEEQQRKAGGPAFFRALGVPGFADGGYTGLGLGVPGEALKAPNNPSSFLNPGSNSNDLTELKNIVASTAAMIEETSRQTNRRIDKIKVQVVANEIETTNEETKKASSIGRIGN